MSSQASGPGKTAPKLLHDLYLFDPLKVIKNFNVLTDAPPIWDEDRVPPRFLNKDSCKHNYIVKSNQSLLPELDERPTNETTWRVATVCTKCCMHATITLDYRNTGNAVCPNIQYPLHHFKTLQTRHSETLLDCSFTCTSWGCNASLLVSYTPPVMNPTRIKLITDQDNLMRRYRAILEEDSTRKDVTLTTPVDALYRLKRYTADALNPTHNKRQFPAHNKKFLGAFGPDCHSFLSDLGFKYAQAEGVDVWQLPNPGLTTDTLRPDQNRLELENLNVELQILLDQMCLRDGTPNPSPRDAWREARQDIERLLSAQAYDRMPNRVLQPTEADHPCFGALGALGDFSDPLVWFAYSRQAQNDPDNVPYYFDCLQQLAQGRQSELLTIKTSEISAQGIVGRKDLVEAYKDLGVTDNLQTAKSQPDSYIINLYRALVADCGQERRARARNSLQKVGHSRGSRAIMNAASDTVETYEEALAYLGADRDMNDEAITALYGTKIGDSQENAQMARRAVELIADERKSAPLLGFINTGELNSYEMDLDEACRHLRIEFDPNMDEGVLNTTFEIARMDNPGQRTDQAIAAVQKALHERSKHLDHSPDTWPVGLESHGNTCYLNSLLQYYFTIKPLRDLVLDIDNYKFDLSAHETKSERVQSIHLKRYEIEAYQKFADHLKFLFERMIKAQGPRVRPDTELVCGAFLKPNQAIAIEESAKGKEPAESLDATMSGIDPEKTPEVSATATVDPAGTANDMLSSGVSNASSATLIEEDNAPPASSQTLTPPASPKHNPPEPQDKPPLPPRPALERAKTQLELAEEAAKRQQDVAEVMEDLLRRLRAAIKPLGEDAQGEQLDQLRELFNMRFTETIISGGVTKTRAEEDATNILLNVPFEPTDIYSALDRVIDLRTDDVAGKPVELYRSFTALPPLLQISVPRIALKDGAAVKVTDSLRLEETIYMDRYGQDPDVLQIRRECWETRKKLRSLQAQKELISKTSVKDMNGPDIIEATSQYLASVQETNSELEGLGIEPVEIGADLIAKLEQEAQTLRARLGPLDDEIREAQESLKGRFDSFTQQKYRLYAVFFHRGGAGGGHYWTNMFDFKNDMWRTYNDETVEEHKNPNDILNAHEWQHGTPTYAVYVRDQVKDALVEPVCRDPEVVEEAPAEQPAGMQTVEHPASLDAWADVPMDNGAPATEGEWDSKGASERGNVTPQKRSSDSPSPNAELSVKRQATAIRLKETQQPEDVSGSSFGQESSAFNLHQRSQGQKDLGFEA